MCEQDWYTVTLSNSLITLPPSFVVDGNHALHPKCFFFFFDVTTGSPLVVFPQSTNFWHTASMIAFDDLPHFFFFSILKIPKPSSSLSLSLFLITILHQQSSTFCFSFIKQLSQYLVWLINGNGDTRATDFSLTAFKSKQQQQRHTKHTKEKEEGWWWQNWSSFNDDDRRRRRLRHKKLSFGNEKKRGELITLMDKATLQRSTIKSSASTTTMKSNRWPRHDWTLHSSLHYSFDTHSMLLAPAMAVATTSTIVHHHQTRPDEREKKRDAREMQTREWRKTKTKERKL